MRALARRVARAEAANVADTQVPHILRVAFGETQAEAHARFAAEYPHRKPGHHVLVVPAKPSTDAEREVWAERFHARQLGLVADARRERIANVDKPTPHAPPRRWPTSPVIRPNGPHVIWKPNA